MGYEIDIYGDFRAHIESDEPDFSFGPYHREDFKIVWPPGYWEEYDQLRVEAGRLSGDPHVRIIVKLNSTYQVRSGTAGRYVYGPETSDRLEAWASFINSISTSKQVGVLKAMTNRAVMLNMMRKVRRA